MDKKIKIESEYKSMRINISEEKQSSGIENFQHFIRKNPLKLPCR